VLYFTCESAQVRITNTWKGSQCSLRTRPSCLASITIVRPSLVIPCSHLIVHIHSGTTCFILYSAAITNNYLHNQLSTNEFFNDRCNCFITAYRMILASVHICVPAGTSLEQWGLIEQMLQDCFQAYGISHVTISPEQPPRREPRYADDPVMPTAGCKQLSSVTDFDCVVSELKKRRLAAA
jgi:hypothetical protein